jgi:hypothetical protein
MEMDSIEDGQLTDGYPIGKDTSFQSRLKMSTLVTPFTFEDRVEPLGLYPNSLLSNLPDVLLGDPPLPTDCYSLNIINSSGGSVSTDPAPNCNETEYIAGTNVSLTATPHSDYFFSGWVDRGDNNPLVITMTNNIVIQPCFSLSVIR